MKMMPLPSPLKLSGCKKTRQDPFAKSYYEQLDLQIQEGIPLLRSRHMMVDIVDERPNLSIDVGERRAREAIEANTGGPVFEKAKRSWLYGSVTLKHSDAPGHVNMRSTLNPGASDWKTFAHTKEKDLQTARH